MSNGVTGTVYSESRRPKVTVTPPPSRSSRSSTLMTPAMASEPYCAEAPSRRTSTLRTAAVGMVLRSTAEEPRPTVLLTLTSAAAWRRLPLSSTRVWSGARPRKAAGRTVSVPSARPGRGKLNEGKATERAWLISGEPVRASCSALMASTGATVSPADRPATRVPVTTMASRICGLSSAAGSAWAAAFCACRVPEERADAMARASRAGFVTERLQRGFKSDHRIGTRPRKAPAYAFISLAWRFWCKRRAPKRLFQRVVSQVRCVTVGVR